MSYRTDYCGTLRADDVGRTVTVCGWVARRREHGEHLAFVDLRDHTGIVQCVVYERPRPALGVRAEDHRHRAPAARGHGQRQPAHRRDRDRRLRGRDPVGGGAAALPDHRPHRGRRERPPPPPLPRHAPRPHAAQPPSARQGQQRHAQRHGPPGLHRDRDADADRVDAGGRPRLRRPVAPAARARSTRCRRVRSCSSSSAWWAAWTATTRWPAACATRTCAPTGSSSSCSSTSR